MVLWYFPECKITVISTSCTYMSRAQNVGKSVKQCVRPLRFPLDIPDVTIQTVETDRHGDFVITVKSTVEAAIPDEPPSPVITVSAALAFRKHRCENTP
jgi:hypothetical protein